MNDRVAAGVGSGRSFVAPCADDKSGKHTAARVELGLDFGCPP
jgi:hypothetical protein